MSEPFLAEVRIFAGNFAPRGWAFCQGQLLAISQYTAVFSLVGTTYGGDGRTTFGLPDMRGRVCMSPGTGPGLSTYSWGQRGGVEQVTLATTQIPSHNHSLHAETAAANSNNAQNNMLALPAATTPIYAAPVATADRTMAATSIGNTGGGQGHENRQPFLCMYYIFALTGLFPSRN